MPMLEENRQQEVEVDVSALDAGSEQKQRRQMLIALALLLFALMLVLWKDREFWFPPSPESAESELSEPASSQTATQSSAKTSTPAPPPKPSHSKPKQHAAAAESAAAPPEQGPVVTSRAVLPPLEVEVVAGDEHMKIPTRNPSIKVDLQPGTPVASAQSSVAFPSSAGAGAASRERVHLSPGAAEIVSRPVQPAYPLLAKQMKIQGAVILDAFIGKDGNIQGLQVVSGPAILSAAAEEAVKQWRFRPYLQAGQPVETEARITVNFMISTQ
jgi:periplasmic protein TonB